MGDVVLGELIGEREGAPKAPASADVFVVAVADVDRAEVLALSHALRERDVRVEYALKAQAVGKQLELAAARGARHAVIIGSAERETGVAVVRDLESKVESRVTLDALRRDYAFTH
jgi:histidyl-tRNA synthetase